MKVLEDKGKELVFAGQTYMVRMSLSNMFEIENKLNIDFSDLVISYKTLPVILSVMINDYVSTHPELNLEPVTAQTISDELTINDVPDLIRLVQSTIAGDKPTEKNS